MPFMTFDELNFRVNRGKRNKSQELRRILLWFLQLRAFLAARDGNLHIFTPLLFGVSTSDRRRCGLGCIHRNENNLESKKKNTHAGFKLFSFLISSVENTLLYVEHLGQTHSAGPCSSADYVCVLSH